MITTRLQNTWSKLDVRAVSRCYSCCQNVHTDHRNRTVLNNAKDRLLSDQYVLPSVRSYVRNQSSSSIRSYHASLYMPKVLSYSGKYGILNRTQFITHQSNVRHFVFNPFTAPEPTGIFKTVSYSMPVQFVQESLQWIHLHSGLPWWAVIVLSTITLRTAIMLPLAVYQHCILARLENLQPELNEKSKQVKQEIVYAAQSFNWTQAEAKLQYNQALKKEWDKLVVRDNCHPMKTGVLVIVQIPLWITLSFAFRNFCWMLPVKDAGAYLTYLEFTNEGFGWIQNLVEVDHFLILPLLMCFLNLFIIEIQYSRSTRELSKLQKFSFIFFRTLAFCFIPITATVPSCLALYWTTSSAYGLCQNLLLMSPRFRRFGGVPATSSDLPNPYTHVLGRLKNRFSRKSRSLSES